MTPTVDRRAVVHFSQGVLVDPQDDDVIALGLGLRKPGDPEVGEPALDHRDKRQHARRRDDRHHDYKWQAGETSRTAHSPYADHRIIPREVFALAWQRLPSTIPRIRVRSLRGASVSKPRPVYLQ